MQYSGILPNFAFAKTNFIKTKIMNMKEKLNFKFLVMLMMFLGGTVCFTACSDDDEPAVEPKVEDMYGEYTGKMQMQVLDAAASTKETAAAGTDVTATVKDNKVTFADFPVRDLVVSIVGEEGAEALLAAIGTVSYEVAYTPTIVEDKTTISMALDPKPLVISLPMGSMTMEVTVNIVAMNNGVYTFANGKLQMGLKVEKVLLNNNPVPTIPQMEFTFDLTKN